MARIIFYTKLGCMTAAKQLALLEQSGHDVEVRDLLDHDWSAEELISYFGEMATEAWFNVKSPRVKSGEIIPDAYEAEEALKLMLSDHLLINRPLMESGGIRMCGFTPDAVHTWIGLTEGSPDDDYFSCSQPESTVQKCP